MRHKWHISLLGSTSLTLKFRTTSPLFLFLLPHFQERLLNRPADSTRKWHRDRVSQLLQLLYDMGATVVSTFLSREEFGAATEEQ